MKMELYISGVLYARLELAPDVPPLIEMLDLFQGKLQPQRPMEKTLRDELLAMTHIDFFRIGQVFAQAQVAIDAGQEAFTLSDGAFYQKKDAHSYIQRQVKFPLDLIVVDGKIVGAQTPNRENNALLIAPEHHDQTLLPRWNAVYPDPPCALEQKQEVLIPMRDGVRLATDLWLPRDAKRPLPCILVRTPYGRQAAASVYYRFVQRGYAVAIQDVRGRNDSEGEWRPFYHETEDGNDTLDYLAAQDWCDGNIGMIGGSYLGYVQWAAAASGNPHLKAIVSEVTAGSAFVDTPRRGGTLTSGSLAWVFMVSQKKADASLMVRDDWDEVLAHRPLGEVCENALGYRVPFWEEWIAHTCDDDYWKPGNWYERALKNGGISVPALIMSGWFDDNGMGTTQALDLTREVPFDRRKVLLGPWMHSGNANYDLHGVYMGDNAIRYDMDLCFFQWFERHLRGVENGCDQAAPIEYFTVGENRWKTAWQWPPENTEEFSLYLGGRQANTSSGHGLLQTVCSREATTDTLVYDPADPATHLIDLSENELEIPEDYTQEELRPDYLCYTTPPLTEDLVITGDATVELYVSSDAPTSDLVVRLTRVDEEGRSIKLADGFLDLKFWDGFAQEHFLESGKVYPVHIRTTKISALFPAGSRLRLTVTSSAKNFSFPNSNTRLGCAAKEMQIARNTLHHGGKYPARILLRRERP